MAEFEIEVVFAESEKQALTVLVVTSGATIKEVVAMSGVLDQFPHQNRDELTFGVWGRVANDDQVVKDGDRVEVYRPLELDPREARRQLALVGRTMGTPETN